MLHLRARQDTHMNIRTLIFATLVLLTFGGAAFSQSQISAGDIKGTVTDSTGGVLPAATVTVTNIDTGVERTAATDAAGNFRFFLLSPGDYAVKVQVARFSTYTRRPVQVTVGKTV